MENYLLAQDDGLPTRIFGKWTVEKLDYLCRYIYMFETAMRNQPWRQRSYIDLFSGTGKFRTSDHGEVHLGSALIALTTMHPFTNYYFSDYNSENIEILKKRCKSVPQKIRYYVGDANKIVKEITEELHDIDKERIPGQWSSLNLAFLDPDGLELEWQTIEILSTVHKMDLIIYYSEYGLNRSLKANYQTKGETIIDKYFGDDEWRKIYEKWRTKSFKSGVHRELIDHYKNKLCSLGYVDIHEEVTGVEPLMRTERTKTPLYRLLFASKHELGHEFWQKVTRKNVWGQRRLL